MNSQIEKMYLDFFEYYDNVKIMIEEIYEKCLEVDNLFEGIVDCIYTYYENKDKIEFEDKAIIHFENEDIISAIFYKIECTINLVNDVYYNICDSDALMFKEYIDILYNISVLEDLVLFLDETNNKKEKYEKEIESLKNIIYNKESITDEFSEYLAEEILKIEKEHADFCSLILIFQFLKSTLLNDNFFDERKNDYIQESVNEFLNNMGSFEELSIVIKKNDILLYNKILKLENVILKLQYSRVSNEKLFGENSKDIINSYLIELIHLYNVWLIELDKVFDLYGIEYVVKYKDLIYYASIVKDIIEYFGDINENDENLGDYYLALYESILNNDMDDFDQFVLYGEDLVDQLCERFELVVNKLEEQIEFLYTLFTKNN